MALPVVTKYLLLYLSVEVALGADVLSLLTPAFPGHLLLSLHVQQGVGGVGTIVVQQQ